MHFFSSSEEDKHICENSVTHIHIKICTDLLTHLETGLWSSYLTQHTTHWPGYSPDTKESWSLAGGGALGLLLKTHDVSQRGHRGRHVPREAHQRADEDADGQHEHVQVIAATFLECDIKQTTTLTVTMASSIANLDFFLAIISLLL